MENEPKKQRGGRRPNQTGRPPKDPAAKAVTVSLSMPGEQHRRLKEIAESQGKSVNDAIREAIAEWVTHRS
jgi:predicted HicB family RNase H-like nuclease